jgi:hypothetical protein
MIRELCLVYKILKWHEKTFPTANSQEQKEKLISEISEFNEAKAKYIKSPYPRRPKYKYAVDSELIDVIIAGINCLKYPDFYERVAVKHNQNTHRKWKGTHHV